MKKSFISTLCALAALVFSLEASEPLQCSPWQTVEAFGRGLDLEEVVWNGERYYAFGSDHPWSSADGRSWIPHRFGDGPERSFRDSLVIWTGSYWLAAASEGIVASEDGFRWRPLVQLESCKRVEAMATNGSTHLATLDDGCSSPERGRILLSDDTQAEQWREIPFDDSQSKSLRHSTWNGNAFFVFADYDGFVLSSIDGNAWTSIDHPDRYLFDMVGGGGIIVTTGAEGVYRSSDDGVSWERADVRLVSLAWTGDRFLGLGQTYEFQDQVLESEDGLVWHAEDLREGLTFESIAGNLSMAVAVGRDFAWRADDGTWQRDPSVGTVGIWPSWPSGADSSGGGRIVVNAAGHLFYSDDDRAWHEAVVETEAPARYFSDIVWSGNHYFVGDFREEVVLRSEDGAIWTQLEMPDLDSDLLSVSAVGETVVASREYGRLQVSKDAGETWSDVVLEYPFGYSPGKAQFGGGRWMVPLIEVCYSGNCPAEKGLVYLSDDLVDFRLVELASHLGRIAAGPPGFVMSLAQTWFSPDGEQWQAVDSPVDVSGFVNLSWAGDRFLARFTNAATGTGIAGISSVDGIEWIVESSLPPYRSSTPWVDGGFVSFSRGTMLRSRCGLDSAAYLPGAAHVDGQLETVWRSDVVVTNPGETQLTVGLDFRPRFPDQHLHAGSEAVFSLLPRESKRIDDAVWTEYGFSGAGTFKVEGFGGSPVLSSRTFTEGASGTFGQGIPAIGAEALIACGGNAKLLQLDRSEDPTTGRRSNVGLVSSADRELEVTISFRDGSGDEIHETVVRLPAGSSLQIDQPLAEASGEGPFSAELSCDDSSASVLAWASTVDNRSGDSIFVLPAASATAGESLFIPAVARTPGADGSFWTSELALRAGESTTELKLRLLRWSQGAPVLERIVQLDAGEGRSIDDVFADLFSTSGAATLEIEVLRGEVWADSRTAHTDERGSYGQRIPAVLPQMASKEQWLTGLEQRSGRSRSNIGLFNPGNFESEVRVELYDAEGELIGDHLLSLQARSSVQINGFEGLGELGEIELASARISAEEPIVAWASVIDSRSNDPVFQLATHSQP